MKDLKELKGNKMKKTTLSKNLLNQVKASHKQTLGNPLYIHFSFVKKEGGYKCLKRLIRFKLYTNDRKTLYKPVRWLKSNELSEIFQPNASEKNAIINIEITSDNTFDVLISLKNRFEINHINITCKRIRYKYYKHYDVDIHGINTFMVKNRKIPFNTTSENFIDAEVYEELLKNKGSFEFYLKLLIKSKPFLYFIHNYLKIYH